jgi:hypothetical protein
LLAAQCRFGAEGERYETGSMQETQSEWCALYVRPRFERIAAIHLQSRNIEEYLPLRRVTRELPKGTRCIELPLFPGYVFCKIHAWMRPSLLRIPGVLQVASVVSDQKISELKRTMQAGLTVQPWRFMATGKTITIQDGILKNITGILDSTGADGQVLVMSIGAIGCSIGVHINSHYTFSTADSAA